MTSIEWLEKQFEIVFNVPNEWIEHAKDLHKQEIMKSYSDGFGNGNAVGVGISNPSWVLNEKEYYQETFVSNGTCGLLKDYHIVEANEMVELPKQDADKLGNEDVSKLGYCEISDTEIEFNATNAWVEFNKNNSDDSNSFYNGWGLAIKWYREQLKQRQ
jgi:hypothetical protein